MLSAAILLLFHAASAASSTTVCADVAARVRDANLTPEQVADAIRKDDRTYDEAVLECLCVLGAPPEIHREARRHNLYDTVPVDAATWSIHRDPLTTPELQVATLLARRLAHDAGRQSPFIVLPVRFQSPSWFDASQVFEVLDALEVPGARLRSRAWLDDQGIAPLPTGDLRALVDEGTIDRFDLGNLVGTYDRALWVDVAPDPDSVGASRLSWSLHPLGAPSSAPPVSRDSVSLALLEEPIVPDCGAPSPRVERKWRGRLRWPAGRVVTAVAGAVVGAVFGGLATSDYVAFRDAAPGDPLNQGRINRNVAFGTLGLVGGSAAILGLSIPGDLWRRHP